MIEFTVVKRRLFFDLILMDDRTKHNIHDYIKLLKTKYPYQMAYNEDAIIYASLKQDAWIIQTEDNNTSITLEIEVIEDIKLLNNLVVEILSHIDRIILGLDTNAYLINSLDPKEITDSTFFDSLDDKLHYYYVFTHPRHSNIRCRAEVHDGNPIISFMLPNDQVIVEKNHLLHEIAKQHAKIQAEKLNRLLHTPILQDHLISLGIADLTVNFDQESCKPLTIALTTQTLLTTESQQELICSLLQINATDIKPLSKVSSNSPFIFIIKSVQQIDTIKNNLKNIPPNIQTYTH